MWCSRSQLQRIILGFGTVLLLVLAESQQSAKSWKSALSYELKEAGKHPFILTVALIEAESGKDVQSFSLIYTKIQKSKKQIKQLHSQTRNRVSCAFLEVTDCASWLLFALESSHFVLFIYWLQSSFERTNSSFPQQALLRHLLQLWSGGGVTLSLLCKATSELLVFDSVECGKDCVIDKILASALRSHKMHVVEI